MPRSNTPIRDLSPLLAVWLALSLVLALFALSDLRALGLYYDEAIFAGLARDFVTGAARPHMPNAHVISLFGRPFPLFVQNYFGGLKCWTLIPSFMVFGSSVSVLRLTTVLWSLIGLLFFMLWTRKLLGLPAALIAAPLLALDPSFFFLSVFDWGGVVPSYLCRLSGFYLFLRWSRRPRLRDGLPAAVLLGLGVFNKIDFLVVLLGCGMALLVAHWQAVRTALRNSRRQIAVCAFGFCLASGAMAFFLSDIFGEAFALARPHSEFSEKLNTLRAMYDGSYFFRLMEVGGRFDAMFAHSAAVWSPFGLAVVLAALFLAVRIVGTRGSTDEGRPALFLLLCLAFITIGVFLLPGAVRMHHSALVYPFPHLAIAAATVMLWKTSAAASLFKWAARGCAVALLALVLGGHLNALLQTEEFIQNTGGRGWWSNSIDAFANDVKDDSRVSIVSVDWGFNEQMAFLTDGKQLSEPIWSGEPLSLSKKAIYLVHPPRYALFPQGAFVLDFARRNPAPGDSVRTYTDREGNVAFYAVRFGPRGP